MKLAKCECCGFVTDWEDVEYVNDPWSDGRVTRCSECNEGESFRNYEPKATIRSVTNEAKEAYR